MQATNATLGTVLAASHREEYAQVLLKARDQEICVGTC